MIAGPIGGSLIESKKAQRVFKDTSPVGMMMKNNPTYAPTMSARGTAPPPATGRTVGRTGLKF